MKEDFTVVAESRKDVGKGASRRLRRTDMIPGVIYGGGRDAEIISIAHDHMVHRLEHETFFSHILTVSVDGKAQKAVLKAVQRHPAKPKLWHVDFQRVSDTHKLHMHIPLHFVGGTTAPGVKAGGNVSHLMTGIDISCLGKDLPEYLEVDMSAMEVGDSLHLSDIKLPPGVEIPVLGQGADHDLPVVSIHKKKGGPEEGVGTAEGGAPTVSA